jgi:hypothetical protein
MGMRDATIQFPLAMWQAQPRNASLFHQTSPRRNRRSAIANAFEFFSRAPGEVFVNLKSLGEASASDILNSVE